MLLEKELGVIEKSYYEASVIRPKSSSALCDSLKVDVCVIGGGYSGLSAALELAERGYKVALLEAQRIGWGASGRNGGQVIVGFGADGETAIEKQLSPENAKRAWNISVEALALLQQRIARYDIRCDYEPGYMTLAVSERKARELEKWYRHITQDYQYPLQWIEPSELASWVSSSRFHTGAYDSQSGHLHPLKYCLGLAAAARAAGVRIFENSAVYTLERGTNPVVKTAQGNVQCNYVVIAANVYVSEYGHIAPEVASNIIPVGTYMIATEPMGKSRAEGLLHQRQAISDNNFVLDYFRLSADNRLLFGAGESYTGTTPRSLIIKMRTRMLNVFPQLSDLTIPFAWGGFVDLTLNKAPNFGRLSKNIFYLQGFSGHGVALTGMAGKLIAETIAGDAEKFDVFSQLRHQKFPGGEILRVPLLMLGMWYYRLRDLL
jgi:gamma-glutamylputrescine oxidase